MGERTNSKKAGGITGKGFQPGVSGNPKGRPRTAEASQLAKAILDREDPKLRKTGLERLFEFFLRRALQGDTKKAELLLAYAYGRPAQSMNLDANVKALKPEEHVDNIFATLGRLSAETDEHSNRGSN